MIWQEDPLLPELQRIAAEDLCIVPFNPTAEHIAHHLVHVIGPQQLEGTGIRLVRCRVDETRKCSATCSLEYPTACWPSPRRGRQQPPSAGLGEGSDHPYIPYLYYRQEDGHPG